MKSFFSKSTVKQVPMTPRCFQCGLHRRCRSPKMPVTGQGKRKVLIVAEAPGSEEDKRNMQLVGHTGQMLRKELNRIGVDLDWDCWKTNAIICWPGEGNPTPSQSRIVQCRPNLLKTIKELEPETIILLGGVAIQSLLGYLYKEDVGQIGQWTGWRIPDRRLNAWVCPTWHPSYVNREAKNKPLKVWWRRHLKEAFKLGGRPHSAWKDLENLGGGYYEKRVQIELEPGFITGFVRSCLEGWEDKSVAFDYETTCLKPETPGAEIVCCSFGWMDHDGSRAVAFPWTPKTKEATGYLLRSKAPKIAANLKFEERWTQKEFGHGVRNWWWDTMQAAHLLDNRSGITGLTFQAYVRLGQAPYDEHIKPYLKSVGKGKLNRIRKLDRRELLLYCGMDALCAYEIAIAQRCEMGFT